MKTDRQVGKYSNKVDVSHCSFIKGPDFSKPMAEKTKNRIYKLPSGVTSLVRAQIQFIFCTYTLKWK